MATSPAELARDVLAQRQRASRAATRGRLEAKLSGNAAASQRLYRDWLPVIEFQQDMRLDPLPEQDSIVRNQDLDDL